MKHTFNVHEGIRGLWLGEASFDATGFDFVPRENTEFRTVLIRGIGMNTTARASEENMSYLLAVQVEEIKLDGSQYGPGVFQMEIRNLDAASISQLQQTLNEIETPALQHSPGEMQQKVLAGYLEILPALLKRSPELEITRLDVKTPYGDFTGKAKVAVDGVKWESHPELSKIPTTLAANVEFKAGEDLVKRVVSSIIKSQILAETTKGVGEGLGDAEVDAMASGMAEEQIQALTVQNVLVVENGTYKAHANYNAGQIFWNDHPLKIQDFMK